MVRPGMRPRWARALRGGLLDRQLAEELPRRQGPGLFEPGETAWRVYRESALVLGGPRALVLQLLHPFVAAGVAEHSRFPDDAPRRLRRTLDCMLGMVFGDLEWASRCAGSIARAHRPVRGTLPEATPRFPAGTPYDARDPGAARYVHLTLIDSAIETWRALVGPLAEEVADDLVASSHRMAPLLGLERETLPQTASEVRAEIAGLFASGVLYPTRAGRSLIRAVLRPPVAPALRPLARLAEPLTAGLLPEAARAAAGLRFGSGERAAFAASAAALRSLRAIAPPSLRVVPHARVVEREIARVGASAAVRAERSDGAPRPPPSPTRGCRPSPLREPRRGRAPAP